MKKKLTHKQLIKKLDEYFDMLSEAFNNPLDIKWVDKGDILIGLFIAYEHVYRINCVNKGDNMWKYDFYLYDQGRNEFSPELTGYEKDKYRVLPTVKVGLEYLDSTKSPDVIVFGATDKSRGRKKLYESFCVDFAKKNNFIFYTKMQDDKQIFILYKNGVDRNILISKVMDIVQEK